MDYAGFSTTSRTSAGHRAISAGHQALRDVIAELNRRFHVNQTVRVEVEGCGANDIYCKLRRSEHAARHVGHHRH